MAFALIGFSQTARIRWASGPCPRTKWRSTATGRASPANFSNRIYVSIPDQTEGKFFATDSKPATCNNLYDLEGVATHERGHTFGLGDLNTNDHPNLTMRGIMATCRLEMRSLGKGDIKGLNDLCGDG